MNGEINLLGKIFIQGDVLIKSGLRIGGPTTGLKIGGVDQPVISDARGRPYIPGSSLKGKMRSLIEKKLGVRLNKTHKVKRGEREIEEPFAHECVERKEYEKCVVCKIWGILGKIENVPTLTRLIVRDVYLNENSFTEEMKRNIELEWTEIKMETAINRYTGTALGGSLRTIDRIPAGAVFSPMEMVYNVFEEEDKKNLKYVFEALELLEHDYLGGMGSRGYGKVEFRNIKIYWNKKEDYEEGRLNQRLINEEFNTPSSIVANFNKILSKLQS